MKKQTLKLEFQPETPVSLPIPKVGDDQWSQLAESLMIQVDLSLGNRSGLDEQLDRGNAMYEMRAQDEERDEPYPGAPNIVVPFIASAVDEFASRISGTAILPRPLIVRGNDPSSATSAHTVEQFYNSEWIKNDWEDSVRTCIHLAGRDGTAIMACNWMLETYTRLVNADVLQMDGSTVKQKQRVTMVRYNAPKWEPVELRDFVLYPSYAKSIDEAGAVMRKRYLDEGTMIGMINADILDAEEVEFALSSVSSGQGDLSYDRQGYSPYTINNRIDVADTSVAPPGGMKMMRGPIQVWQIHSDLYDLDGDGVAEENIFWVHDRTRRLLGFVPYEYWGGRPYIDLSPFPRPNRFYGFSIPERLAALQNEADLQHIGRLELLDWILNPTTLKTTNAKVPPEDQKIGKSSIITVSDVRNDLAFMGPPMLPQDSVQEEQLLGQYAERLTGAPQMGGQPSPSGQNTGGSGRVSARAAQSQAAVQGMQTNMVISRVRKFILKLFKFSHALYKQYGEDQNNMVDAADSTGTKAVVIPKEILGQDFTLGIAGQGGPLDKESRRTDTSALYQTLMQSPLVQGKMDKVWAITADLLETYDKPEVTRFIGTMDEARQQGEQQAQAQQAQQQQEMQMALLDHAKIGKVDAPGGN